MFPSNPFGGSQGGQPTSDSQSQSFGFYQAPTFGQFSPQGNAFFGQPTIPVTSVSGGSQATAFGQSIAKKTISVFGSHSSFGGSSLVLSGIGKQRQDSSQQPSNLETSSEAFNSSLGPSPTLSFGPTVFEHPPSTIVTTSVFSSSSTGAENKGFTSSNFSFKPVTESLFKPIFGAGPKTQTSSMPDSTFGKSESQTTSSTLSGDSASTNFFSLPGAKSRSADFNFSQPSSSVSVTAQNTLTTGSSSANTVEFTFSQPLPLSSSSGLPSTSKPTTPSSFSFSFKPSEPQKTKIFKGTSFDQSSLFGDTKINADASGDEKGQNLVDTNLFTAFSRGTKRKEGALVSSTGLEKSTTNEGVPAAEADSTAHLKKRSHMRFRGPLGGIFGRAVNDLCRDGNNSGATKVLQQQLTLRETEKDQVQAQTNSSAATAPKDPSQESMNLLQKSEESGEMMCVRVVGMH